MKIPCKDCLVLPICRPKTEIYCDLLEKEACKIDVDASQVVIREWWKLVQKYIPNAHTIRDSKGKL